MMFRANFYLLDQTEGQGPFLDVTRKRFNENIIYVEKNRSETSYGQTYKASPANHPKKAFIPKQTPKKDDSHRERIRPLEPKFKKKPADLVHKKIRDTNRHRNVNKVDLKKYYRNDRKLKFNPPPLKDLIVDEEEGINGDVRFMLDFAVLGHAKCATTFVNGWLRQHQEVQIFEEEVCDLNHMKPAALVKKLYKDLPAGDFQRGYKCPGHFSRRPMRYFRQYFNKTKLVVGVRHPIKWFESYYNFVSRHGHNLPHPNKCIGECTPQMMGVCTQHSQFHQSLAVFGKTNVKDPKERRLLRMPRIKYQFISRIDNPIFLYHSDQLYDKNATRFERMRFDFQHYLGLAKPMPNATKYISTRGKTKAINICETQYAPVREELLKVGARASAWIRRYFLDSPQVFFSDRVYLQSLIRDFENDPCLLRKR